jgi:hydroxymethylpyrimidine/phosphomethylpyrimidine kinase
MTVLSERRACVVAIGGFDPTGGAGVVRDFVTGRSLAAEIRMVPTALTEQSSAGVSAIEARSPADLQSAVAKALMGFGGGGAMIVVKVGMLPGGESVDAVVRALSGFDGPIVVDPVLSTSSGGRLFRAPVSRLQPLLVRAALVTPNVPELAELTGDPIATLDDAVGAGKRCLASGVAAVLVKGGHLGGAEAIDVLLTRTAAGVTTEQAFRRPRLAEAAVRGTGCALAMAVATGLSRGLSLAEAVGLAKDWLHRAIRSAVPVGDEFHLGH